MKSFSRIISFVLVLVLVLGSVPMTGFAKGDVKLGVAFVDASSLRLRSEASTSSQIVDTAYRGEVVVVVSKHGDWYKVIYNLTEGYMHSDYLEVRTSENVELGYGRISGTSVNLRSGAGTSSKAVAQGNTGDKAYILGINNGWYKVIFGDDICYIRSDYLDLTEVPYENKDSSNSPRFYRGGESLGTEPSAGALSGSTGSSVTVTAPTVSSSSTTTEASKSETTETGTSTESTATADGIKYGIGFTTGSGLRLRSSASTSAKTLDSASKGEVVVVLSKQGDWYRVIYDLKEGYMHGDYLDVSTTENAELGYGKVTGSSVNLRSGPGTSYSSVAKASKGDKAYILGINNGWYKVIYGSHVCYIRSDFLELTETPYENNSSSKSPKFYRGGKSLGTEPSAAALNGSTGSSSTGSSSTGSSSTGSQVTSGTTGDQILAKAKQYLGVPYKWGGTTPSGFDCSGYVYYVLRSLGINASRTLKTMYSQGTPVDKADLQPGDIVFFKNTYKSGISHVGIYAGNGQFIHSPHSGTVVSYADLNSTYYINHYYGAVRFTK